MIRQKIAQREYTRRVGATKFQTLYRAHTARNKFALLRLAFKISQHFTSSFIRHYLHIWNTKVSELRFVEKQRFERLSLVQSFLETRFKHLAMSYVDTFIGERHDVVVEETAEILQNVMNYADTLDNDHAAVSVRIKALEMADDARQATKDYLDAKREYEEAQLLEGWKQRGIDSKV